MTERKGRTLRRWWPTSKMTGVGIVWGLVTYGTFAFTQWYGLRMDLVSAVAIAGGIMFLAGYSITEHRCNCGDD